MTGAVTYEQVSWFFAEIVIVASFLITVAKVVWGRIEKVQTNAQASIEALEEDIAKNGADLSAYKLEVATKYASIEHLKETEERLVTAINKLEVSIAAMPASIAALIKTGRQATRRRS